MGSIPERRYWLGFAFDDGLAIRLFGHEFVLLGNATQNYFRVSSARDANVACTRNRREKLNGMDRWMRGLADVDAEQV